MGKGVFLWTVPRSVSTAFEFSVRTLPNVKVFNGPYTAPFYYGPKDPRQSLPAEQFESESAMTGTREIVSQSYEEASHMLQASYPGKDLVFAKACAYTVRGHFDIFLDAVFKDFTHSFLIRHPQRSILSFYKGCTKDSAVTGWSHFDRDKVGFVELENLYDFVATSLHARPVIVDADDLLSNPPAMMKAYCAAVGLPYNEGMTTWKPGGSEEFLEQKVFGTGWNQAALKSSGFMKLMPLPDLPGDIPKDVVECIEECLVPYRRMYTARLLPKGM